METTAKKCAHVSCDCLTTDESHYCSTYCSGQAATLDIACSCGHGSCGEPLVITP